MTANMTIILVPIEFKLNNSILSDGFRSFDETEQNSNPLNAMKLFPTPKPNETAQQTKSNIERMKQRLRKSEEAPEISEKNWSKIIADFNRQQIHYCAFTFSIKRMDQKQSFLLIN